MLFVNCYIRLWICTFVVIIWEGMGLEVCKRICFHGRWIDFVSDSCFVYQRNVSFSFNFYGDIFFCGFEISCECGCHLFLCYISYSILMQRTKGDFQKISVFNLKQIMEGVQQLIVKRYICVYFIHAFQVSIKKKHMYNQHSLVAFEQYIT